MVDRSRSAERIERDIETLAGPDFTRSSEAIQRYAYTPEYRRTLDHFAGELRAAGYTQHFLPVEEGVPLYLKWLQARAGTD